MIVIYKSQAEEFAAALQTFPYVFSIRDYAYFFTRQEWNSIQVTNVQPVFNADTQDLVIEEYELNSEVKRRWIVIDKQPEPDPE
jgi:hypothetical protein